eukprot:2630293-Amphidinium_carterae.1
MGYFMAWALSLLVVWVVWDDATDCCLALIHPAATVGGGWAVGGSAGSPLAIVHPTLGGGRERRHSDERQDDASSKQ